MANTIRAELFDINGKTLATQDYSVQEYVKTYFQLYSKDFSLEADDFGAGNRGLRALHAEVSC